MPKTKISEFSATPANNTDIDSINIAEGCAPSGINDAIRELMAQLKDFQTGAVGDSFNGPIGAATAATGAFTTLSATGAITSTLATGSAPLVIASTTKVANLNVDLLDGADWASPAALGSTTPAAVSATTLSATGVTTLQAGTVSLPALTTTGDTNTGIFFPAADTIAFTEGGAEAVRINSSGNVLIGYTTDQSSGKLQVNGAGRIGAFDFNTDDITYGGGGNFRIGTVFGVPMLFKTSDTERMRILSGGNVGIGTTGPVTQLQVNSGSSYVGGFKSTVANGFIAFQDSGTSGALTDGNVAIGAISNDLAFRSGGATRMRLDSAGNLGIGTSSPSVKLEVAGAAKLTGTNLSIVPSTATSAAYVVNTNTGGNFFVGIDNSTGASFGTGAYGRVLYSSAAYPMAFFTNDLERARIDSSGNLLVSTTSSTPRDFTTGSGGTKIPVAGGALEHATTNANCMFINRIGSGAITALIDFRQNASSIGSISYNGTLVVYNTTSDYRLKTVVGAVTGHGARIDALEPIEYTWNSNGSRTRGFLAHKFQEVYADSVTGEKDAVDADGNPVYQSMQASTSEVIADLVAEIQSLRKRLADAGI